MEGKAMTFRVGQIVARNDKPEETYRIAKIEYGLILFVGTLGAFNQAGFHLVGAQPKSAFGIEQPSHTHSIPDLYGRSPVYGEFAVTFDTNEEESMQDRDLDREKEKAFERIMRKREFDKRVKELKKPSGVAETYWDGEHLANAIEKTVSTAMTPQAMWKL